MTYNSRSAVLNTARAVLDALPSSYLPAEISYEEALSIGKQLMPEWLLIKVKNPDQRAEVDVMLEFLARGLLFSAIAALPQWLVSVWVEKTVSKDRDSLMEFTCDTVYHVSDAEKLARNWIMLACGYSEEEVIESEIQRIDEHTEPVVQDKISKRLSEMEDM